MTESDNEFWACAHLKFQGDDRDEARRAVALNFCIGPDGMLKDYDKEFPKILALLKGSDPSNVVPFAAFVPRAVADETG